MHVSMQRVADDGGASGTRVVCITARTMLTTARGMLMTARTLRLMLTTALAAQKRLLEPGPPPSQSALELRHGFEQMLGGGLGAGCAAGGRGGGDGMETSQSTQSVPKTHVANSERGPMPSLHKFPPTLRRLFVHTMAGEWGGGGGRPSQSAHSGNSKPGPPSSQSAP